MNWGPTAEWPDQRFRMDHVQGAMFGNYNQQHNVHYHGGIPGDWPCEFDAFMQCVSAYVDRRFLDALISVGRGRLDLVVQTLNMYRPIVATTPGAWQMLLHATALNHSPSVVVGALPSVGRTLFEHDVKTVLRTAFMRPFPEAFQIATALDDHGLRAFVSYRTVEELAEYPRVFSNDLVLKIVSAEKTAVELARLIKIFRSMRTDPGDYYARVLISCCEVTTNARDLADALRREGLRKDAKHFDGIWARRNRRRQS